MIDGRRSLEDPGHTRRRRRSYEEYYRVYNSRRNRRRGRCLVDQEDVNQVIEGLYITKGYKGWVLVLWCLVNGLVKLLVGCTSDVQRVIKFEVD